MDEALVKLTLNPGQGAIGLKEKSVVGSGNWNRKPEIFEREVQASTVFTNST